MKIKTTHTPGPWYRETGDEVDTRIVADNWDADDSDPGYWVIAEMAKQEGHDEEARANARLIAAAPDLLAALSVLEASFTVPCRFTITKKTDDCYTCGKTPDGYGGTRVCDQCSTILNARAAIAKAEGR